MARRDYLTRNRVAREKSQKATYGTQTPLSSAAVERGRTRWLDGSQVVIEGLLSVSGTASISGTLNASGTINLSGSTGITGPLVVTGTTTISGNTSITGELVVTGPTTLDGETEIGGDTTITGTLDIEGNTTVSGKLDVTGAMSTKGTLSVEGVTTIKNDLNITSGGKIKAGNLEIEPANGGQINFSNGSIAASNTFGLLITHSEGIQLNGASVTIAAATKAGATANVHIDSAGRLWRI